jgi:hypothetical protein
MKRKTNGRESFDGNGQPDSKKRALSSEEVALRFRDGLFDSAEQQKYTKAYSVSEPYVGTQYIPIPTRVKLTA